MQKSADTLSDELKFLVACCRVHPDAEEVNNEMSGIEGKNIAALASRHGVLPLVYKTLKGLDADGWTGRCVDEKKRGKGRSDTPVSPHSPIHPSTHSPIHPSTHLLNSLRSAYQAIAQRNILMSAELLQIMKLLEENGIGALAFKGPALAQAAYGDITMRQYSDLDILVGEHDAYRAGKVLQEHRYRPLFSLETLKNKTCLSVTNDLGFRHRGNGTFVELHWKLFREKIGNHLDFEKIGENGLSVGINGKTVPTLSAEMLLVYLCLHGSKHAWERLEWICDVDRLVRARQDLNWDEAVRIATEMDTRTAFDLGLLLSRTFFHTPVPSLPDQNAERDLRVEKLFGKTCELMNGLLTENEGYARYSTIHLYQMDLLNSKRKKFRHLIATYFGISRNDCQGFLLPPSLKFLYLPVKPLRVIGKYLRYGR